MIRANPVAAELLRERYGFAALLGPRVYMAELTRYLLLLRLNGVDHIAGWDSDGAVDRVVLDEDGFIRTFADADAAREAAVRDAVAAAPHAPAVYDLDTITAWCRSDETAVDCAPLLNLWNLFGDLPRGELYAAADAQATPIYDKLFFGCNLPAMTQPGEHYTPAWTASELATLKRLMLLGLAELRARIRP